jgi:hypothetical protein
MFVHFAMLAGPCKHAVVGMGQQDMVSRRKIVESFRYRENEPKTEVQTNNGLPSSMLSGRVSYFSFGDRRVP